MYVRQCNKVNRISAGESTPRHARCISLIRRNIALCGTYRVTAFFGRVEFRKGEDEFMRSIEVSRPRSTSDSGCASQPPYDFIESDNTSYHVRGGMSMNIFRVSTIGQTNKIM